MASRFFTFLLVSAVAALALNTNVSAQNCVGSTVVGTNDDDDGSDGGESALIGSSCDERISGRGGNDVLDGNGGSDIYVGGNGADLFKVDDEQSIVTIMDWRGSTGPDFIFLVELEHITSFDQLRFSQAHNMIHGREREYLKIIIPGVFERDDDGEWQRTERDRYIYLVNAKRRQVSEGNFIFHDPDGFDGSAWQRLTVVSQATLEDDVLEGTINDNGVGQDDDLSGFSGNDMLIGGDGDDTLNGDYAANLEPHSYPEGNDTLDGGNGDDTLYGGGGADDLIGGPGADTLDGGSSTHTRNGIEQQNTDLADYRNSSGVNVDLNDNSQTMFGDADGDTLTNIEGVRGSNEKDFLYGNDQANLFYGEGDDDWIYG